MARFLTKEEVAPKLKTGDLIEYKTIKGYKQVFIVTQAPKKFIYQFFGERMTYNELKEYMKCPDFKIVSNKQTKQNENTNKPVR